MAPSFNSLEIRITIPKASDLGDEQKKLLTDRTEAFAKEMFDHAVTYEGRHRGDSSKVRQITTTHIKDGYSEARRRYKPPRRDRILEFLLRLLLYLAAAGIGVGGNKLDQTWGVAMFWASLTAGLFAVAVAEIRGWRGE